MEIDETRDADVRNGTTGSVSDAGGMQLAGLALENGSTGSNQGQKPAATHPWRRPF